MFQIVSRVPIAARQSLKSGIVVPTENAASGEYFKMGAMQPSQFGFPVQFAFPDTNSGRASFAGIQECKLNTRRKFRRRPRSPWFEILSKENVAVEPSANSILNSALAS
jgi:hypothetical protein